MGLCYPDLEERVDAVLDMNQVDKDFRTTEFITEHGNPETILIKRAVHWGQYIDGMKKISIQDIDIVLKRGKVENAFNGGYSSTHKIKSFKETYYSLTNLRVNKNLVRFYSNLSSTYDQYIENPSKYIDKKKVNATKDEMLSYLIIRQILKGETTVFTQPIKIVLQDTELHESSYGAAYEYYIIAFDCEPEIISDSGLNFTDL